MHGVSQEVGINYTQYTISLLTGKSMLQVRVVGRTWSRKKVRSFVCYRDELGKESNFIHTEHNAFGDPGNVAMVRRITFYSDINVMNEFFRLNPKPRKLRALFCFITDRCVFSHMAHLNFKLLQVLVVVTSRDWYSTFRLPNKFGNMSCLRYLRLEGLIRREVLPNSIVKLKCLETLDIHHSYIGHPESVWESKQLRHLLYNGSSKAHLECRCCSISSFFPNVYSSLPPNNLQTLMWMDDKFFEPRLLHRLINLRKLGIVEVSDSTIKILSTLSPVPTTLEVLKLSFSYQSSEQINLSSFPNIVKLYLELGRTTVKSVPPVLVKVTLCNESFPPNLVRLTLHNFEVEGHVVVVLKKLPKLRILKMISCKYNEEKMDLSGDGDSFPQLEVLHIKYARRLSEVTCRDDVSMPKLKKLLLTDTTSNIRLSEHLAKLRI